MTPSEIIKKEAQKVGYDADVLLRKINKLVSNGTGILLHKNNSLLLLIFIAKGVVELHLITDDKPAAIADSLKYFINKIKESDIQKVYGSTNSIQHNDLQKTLGLLDKMGIDVQKPDNPRYHWMATVEGSK